MDAKSNHGHKSTKMSKGGKFVNPYGKSTSDVGGASSETASGMKGGTDNLSHSLSGASAKQRA